MSMTYEGIALRVADPARAARWLRDKLGFDEGPAPGGLAAASCGDCRILLGRAAAPISAAPAEASGREEGRYTGIAHLALATADIALAIRECRARGLRLAGGDGPSHNPSVWGTGMDYVNLQSPLGIGLELSQRLDLPRRPPDGRLVQGLEHVGVQVARLDRALSFYEALGFALATSATIHRGDGQVIRCAMLRLGGLTAELYEFVGAPHEPFPGPGRAELLFGADDLDALLARCRGSGGRIEQADGRSAAIGAPDGETLRVTASA